MDGLVGREAITCMIPKQRRRVAPEWRTRLDFLAEIAIHPRGMESLRDHRSRIDGVDANLARAELFSE